MKKFRVVLLVLATASFACSRSSVPITAAPTVTLVPASPTPFQPVAPTETPSPTQTLTPTPSPTPFDWGRYPPSRPSSTRVPEPVRELVGENRVNIMVIGTDDAPGRRSLNSDVIVLVSIDKEEGTVSMVSFPRDLYVYLPGLYMSRINTAYAYWGSELLGLTMLYNFGVRVDYYARVNFANFRKIVDTLGGIDVTVGTGFTDYCGRYYTFRTGETYPMDGTTALCYARMRKGSGGDFARQIRHQEILLAMFKKAISLEGLTRFPELYVQFQEMVETDMGILEATALLPTAAKVATDTSRIESYSLRGLTTAWRTPGGAQVHLPKQEEIHALLKKALD